VEKCLTAEQINDSMFRYLDGSEDDLLAYWVWMAGWRLQDRPTRAHRRVERAGGRRLWRKIGCAHQQRKPLVQYLQRYAFPQRCRGPPGAAEYGDMQYDAGGSLVGVMKRCYIFTDGGRLNLSAGFKIGDLEMQYIGRCRPHPRDRIREARRRPRKRR
jgi:hypothetical protein